MRNWINLLEGQEDPSALVAAQRDRWCEELGKTPEQINDGLCFDFAEELETDHYPLFQAFGFGNLQKPNADGFDMELLSQHFPQFQPPKGLDWNDMWKLFHYDGTHGWAYCERTRLCYDIEHVEGVANVFELNFLQKFIRDYVARGKKLAVADPSAPDGVRVLDEAEGKRILYHGTNREFRDEIMKHGLLRSKSETAQLAQEMGEADWESFGGIFFSNKPPSENSSQYDCWAVDVTGLNLERDDTTDHDHLGEEWWVTYTDPVIEPSRLKLVQR